MNIDELKKTVSDVFNITVLQLDSRTRERHVVEARQCAMHILRSKTSYSLAVIAGFFSKDHATVIHSCKTVESLLMYEPEFKKKYETVLRIFPFFNPIGLGDKEITLKLLLGL